MDKHDLTRTPLAGDCAVQPQACSIDGTSKAIAARFWRIVVPTGLVFLVIIAFMPALQAGFVQWDDDDLLLQNTRYQRLTLDSLWWMLTTSYAGHFQPLTWLSYAVDYAIWGGEALGYHLTNVVLHALNAVIFYFVARQLLAQAWSMPQARRSLPVLLSAAFSALLFAVHPLRAESVAWIAERRDVLSGFFFLLAVGCYLRYAIVRVSAPADSSARRLSLGIYYGLAIITCAISLLSKAIAVTLPLVLLILDVYPLRRFRGSAARPGNARRVWSEKIPFFALSLAAGLRALYAQEAGGALYSLVQHDWQMRLAQASYGLVFYLAKTVWPLNLGPLYPLPSRDVLLGMMLWTSLFVLIAMCVVTILLRRRYPGWVAAFAAYLVILTPVLGLAQSGPQLVADRYSYLSCLGFAVLGGGGILALYHTNRHARSPGRDSLTWLGTSVVVTLLAHATFAQADIWQSPLSLWTHGVRVSPESSIAHVNLADALVHIGEYQRAAEHYRRGLALDPRDAIAWQHFGKLWELARRPDEAITHYLRALSIDPTRRVACLSLARLLRNAGREQQAISVLRDGLQRHSQDKEMADLLAEIQAKQLDEPKSD